MSGRVNDPVKGLAILISACRRLWEKRQDFELVITSTDPKLAREPFVTSVGWIRQEDLPAVYQSSDICIVPSIWEEAFGITALEAMACAKPVVASAIGGLKLTVRNEQTGFLVPPNDSVKLFDRITMLLDNKTLRTKFGQSGRNVVVKEYDWDIILNKYYIPILS